MTVRETLGEASRDLSAAGVATARLDAEVLLAGAMSMDRGTLLTWPDRAVGAGALAQFRKYIDRRSAREPVSHILGEREFWSLPFHVGPTVLDPRPDSETLIDAALAFRPGRVDRVLDLGTGSGCLLLALLSELPETQGVGIDNSGDAVAVARRNAERNGLAGRARFITGDWATAKGADLADPRRFDIVLANPPYIPSADIAALAPEVREFEPVAALDGGPDGLDAYRALLPVIAACLAAGGRAFIEIGAGQSGAVSALAAGAGLKVRGVQNDLGRIERCIILQHR